MSDEQYHAVKFAKHTFQNKCNPACEIEAKFPECNFEKASIKV